MTLTRNEKKLVIAACVVASLLGCFAAYVAYALELENQFHGGILEEDAAEAAQTLIWVAAIAFAEFWLGAMLILAVVPVAAKRYFPRIWK